MPSSLRPDRRAFTLLEVLLSILLLFLMGLALLKFDSWTEREISRYRTKARLLLQDTPLLYQNLKAPLPQERPLETALRFTTLRDDEIFWLKEQKALVQTGKEERKELFQSGDIRLYYRYYPLRLGAPPASLSFIRVQP